MVCRLRNLLPYNQQNTRKHHFSSCSYEGPFSSLLKDELDDEVYEPPNSPGSSNAEDNCSGEEARHLN